MKRNGWRRVRLGVLIRSAKQVRALYAPARQEVLDALEAAGPCSIAELARLLGRRATALYAHVEALVRVGLIVPAGSRRDGRHVAAAYDVADRPMVLDYDGPAGRRAMVRVVSGAVRLSQREFARSCVRGAKGKGGDRVVWGGRARGWLTGDEVRKLNGLLREAQELLRRARPRQGARAISLGFILSPVEATGTVVERQRRRARAARKE